MCQALLALEWLIRVYSIVLFVYAVLSWVPDLRGSWARYVDMVVEPVLAPLRRVIPPAGGIDWSFLALFALIWIFRVMILAPAMARACYF